MSNHKPYARIIFIKRLSTVIFNVHPFHMIWCYHIHSFISHSTLFQLLTRTNKFFSSSSPLCCKFNKTFGNKISSIKWCFIHSLFPNPFISLLPSQNPQHKKSFPHLIISYSIVLFFNRCTVQTFWTCPCLISNLIIAYSFYTFPYLPWKAWHKV